MTTNLLTGRADPRATRTRKLIQQALEELLGQKSFPSISIGDITERATVNRSTFYAHFQDKDDLLEQMVRERCRAVLCVALLEHRQPTPEIWRSLIEGVLKCFAQMPKQCSYAARQWNGLVANAMQEELKALLSEWLAEVHPSPPVRQTVIDAISGVIVASGMQWLRGEADVTPEVAAAELTAFILNGMSAAPSG